MWRATGSLPSTLPDCGNQVRRFAAVFGDASVATVRALMVVKDGIDQQLLHYAQSAEMVQFLVNEVGCPVDNVCDAAETSPMRGRTPLWIAAYTGNVAVARQLVHLGARADDWLDPELRALLMARDDGVRSSMMAMTHLKIRLIACSSGESLLRAAIELLDGDNDLRDNVLRSLLDGGCLADEKLLVWLAGAGVGSAATLTERMLARAPQGALTLTRALHVACGAGKGDVARLLLNTGASVVEVINSTAGMRLSSEIREMLLRSADDSAARRHQSERRNDGDGCIGSSGEADARECGGCHDGGGGRAR